MSNFEHYFFLDQFFFFVFYQKSNGSLINQKDKKLTLHF
ncbi:unnamed protein product [Brassica oleracea]